MDMTVKAILSWLGVYVALAPLPLVAGEYYTHILTVSCYYVIMAASWNLLAGYTGQFSLAHHAFAALGGYTSALLAIYLALATWAFAESLRLVIAMEYQITRGDLGLATPFFFRTPFATPYFYLFLLLALGSLGLMRLIVRSKIGFYMRAIRDDEEAALTMGVDTVKWKRFVFAVSSLFAGIAGGFYAHYIGLLSPALMKFN